MYRETYGVKIMDKKFSNLFRGSITCVVVVSALVFLWLTVFMIHRSRESIEGISYTYMTEMSNQVQQRFQTIIDLRTEQIEELVERYSLETMDDAEGMFASLERSAKNRAFNYLALYADNGDMDVIYGDELEIADAEYVMDSLNDNGRLIALGKTDDGKPIFLLGVKAEYPMEDGRTSTALIAGSTLDYLDNALFFRESNTMIYFNIIDEKGEIVIGNSIHTDKNYFDRMRDKYKPMEGKRPEEYVNELEKVMKDEDTYFAHVVLEDIEGEIYCMPLPETLNWYLICAMPTTFLTDSITELSALRIRATSFSVVLIFIVLAIVFVLYYRLSQQQIKELEIARTEADRANIAKSDFLSSMSHDIRTPMNAIIGMTGIAQKNIDDKERVEDCLSKISLSSNHLLSLINDVLDMSKIDSGKMVLNMAPICLREIMDNIVNIIQPQVSEKEQLFDIYIQNIMSENVLCDSVRLNQVLMNLLSNAVKFTPTGGEITIHIYQEQSPVGEDHVRTHFLVKDTGIGMSPEFQAKIWNSFEREETEQVRFITGTGLGTSIAKRIVDLMNGTIDLQSEQGKGSTFHVTLDLKKSDVSQEEMVLPEWNILVVDDNQMLCESVVSNLEELGTHAEWTLSGRKAVEMIEERHNKEDDYHFVLIDWKMPDMDGVETIREIRKRVGIDIPIFLVSAYDFKNIEDQLDPSTIEGFISKPLFKSTLYYRLRQYTEVVSGDEDQGDLSEISFKGKRILLAEDIDLNWEVASEILSITEMELQRAVNGKECVELFEKSEVGYYDAILMDLRMPVMDGYHAAEAIRSLDRPDKDLPIIAMTADAFSDDVQRCMDFGMNAHIAKPIDVKECMRVLQQYLGKKESSEGE